MVAENVHYQDPLAKTQVKGWIDVDVLAIAKDEVCIIQTKAFAIFEKTVAESIVSTIEYFKSAQAFVSGRYDIKGKKIRLIFAADYGLSKNIKTGLRCKRHGKEGRM
jgi:hypothetical protein